MTTAPSHPPVHAYEGENPFDIVDSAWGSIERWRAVALSTGELGALTVLSKHVKNDSIARMDAVEQREAALSARQDALDARERAIAVMAAQVTDMAGRVSVALDRLHKIKADAEEEPLPSPPGSDAVSTSGDPSDPSKEPEPSLELEGDAALPGDPSDPAVRDQDEPPAGGVEFPDPELPKTPVVSQPIAAGLDDERSRGIEHEH